MYIRSCGLVQLLTECNNNYFTFLQKFLSTIKPSRNWGPVDPIYRHCWVQWKKQYQVTGERDFTLRRRGTRDYTHSIKRGKHAAPPGTAYSVSPTSLYRTSSCYSVGGNSPPVGGGGSASNHQNSLNRSHHQQQQHLHQLHYNHAMADQRRWAAAEPKHNGANSINYMWSKDNFHHTEYTFIYYYNLYRNVYVLSFLFY